MTDRPYPLWNTDDEPALLASRDRDSGEIVFPALPSNSPLAARHDTVPIARRGRLYSFTVLHPGPKSGALPHALGLVDFPGPVRLFGRLTGSDRPVIGSPLAVQPDEQFGYVFTPLAD